MDVKAALYTFLQSKSLLTNLIGTRLYADVTPEGFNPNQLPYVVYYLDDQFETHNLLGQSNMPEAWFSFVIYAASPVSRNNVKEAIRNICDGRRNEILTDGVNSINCRSMFVMNPNDSYEPRDAEELGTFVSQVSLQMIYFSVAATLP